MRPTDRRHRKFRLGRGGGDTQIYLLFRAMFVINQSKYSINVEFQGNKKPHLRGLCNALLRSLFLLFRRSQYSKLEC